MVNPSGGSVTCQLEDRRTNPIYFQKANGLSSQEFQLGDISLPPTGPYSCFFFRE